MTYASISYPKPIQKNEVSVDAGAKQTLKGRLTSALKNAGASAKNAIQNPGQMLSSLSKYMLDNKDKIQNKFSGIAVAQALMNGNVSNKDALDYLFLGFAPAMDKEALAMGYSGATQMKDAMANGTINVGNFVSGFEKTLKGITDFNNNLKNKEAVQGQEVIPIDIVKDLNIQFQSETTDRRVEDGISYSQVIHNLPEIFSLGCGLQEGKNYTVEDFENLLKTLRASKQVFSLTRGGVTYENLVLENFAPAVLGPRSGIDYTLTLKQIKVGSIELTPITIKAIPQQAGEGNGINGNASGTGGVSIPNIADNSANSSSKLKTNKTQSLWAASYDAGNGNVARGVFEIMGGGIE